MTTKQTTSADWIIIEKPGVWVGPVIAAENGDRGIAFVCGQSTENADLIAAAPDLLTALQDTLGELEWLCECHRKCKEEPDPEIDATIAQARAAISKAKGIASA